MNGARESPTLRDRLFVTLQHVLPQHLLSRVVHRLTRCRQAALKNALIGAFMRHFHPDMSEAAEPEALSYPSFNAFFTRELRLGSRPADPDPCAFDSPVDGTVSQIGSLRAGRIVQAKGHDYSVQSLLGGQCPWAARFENGAFATLYLAPYNYHRVHMPMRAALCGAWYVPGRLFSVNATTAAAVPGLFARNERLVLLFEDGPRTLAVVLVGALFVGSMGTIWHGDVTPRTRIATPLPLPATTRWLEKGMELGRFNMGSTVIVLLPKDAVVWSGELAPGSPVRVGQRLGRLMPLTAPGREP